MSSILINQSLYFRKSVLGDNRTSESQDAPVQLVYPNGNIQLGLPQNARAAAVQGDNANNVVIVSGPEKFASDYRVRDALALSLFCIGLLNIILTCELFGNAPIIDPSKVVPAGENSNNVNEFQIVPSQRTGREDFDFTFLILITLVGMISSVVHSSLGLSVYALGLVLNYMLSMSSIPYFAYSLRFVLDAVSFYLALVLRSKLMYIYLPVDVRDINSEY